MNLAQFYVILIARWRMVAIAALVCFNLALGWVLFAPDRYAATAQVLVDVRAPATVAVQGDAGVTPQLSPDYVSTQVDVIRSQRVAIAAVRKLGILNDPDAMADYRDSGSHGDPAVYFADRLSDKLQITPSVTSRVISITYTNSSAEQAAAVANAFANAYREVSVDLQREPARNEAQDYKQSIRDIGNKLQQAEAQLSTMRGRYGITAVGTEGTDGEDARLTALSTQLAMAQATQAAQNQRGAGGAIPDALQNPVIQSIQSEIARDEAQRQQLATFAGPNNLDYQQLNNRLAALRSQLAQQRSLVARGAAVSSSQASASVAQLQQAVSDQRNRVVANQKSRGEIAALEENVQNLKSAYDALVAKQLQSTVLGAAEQSNVVVLAPASVPALPAGLPKLLRLVAGLLLGAIIGTLLAIVVEVMDQRLRRSEDVQVWLGIADLGSVRRPALASPHPRRLTGRITRYLPGPGDRKPDSDEDPT